MGIQTNQIFKEMCGDEEDREMKLNDTGQVGPAIVFIMCIIMIPLSMFILTPIVDKVGDLQQDQIDDGLPVSEERIDVMNNLLTIFNALIWICLIISGVWLWITSNRESSGGI